MHQVPAVHLREGTKVAEERLSHDQCKLKAYIDRNPGLSASQIANNLKLRVNSVSSTLCKYVNQQILRRSPGRGPRGGFVYYSLDYVGPYPTRFDQITL